MAQSNSLSNVSPDEVIWQEDVLWEDQVDWHDVSAVPIAPQPVSSKPQIREENVDWEIKPTLIKAAKTIGGQLVGTGEATMSLASGALLWPFSKAYGILALPWGAEAAKMAEESIASLGYQPYGKEGREAVELVSKGMELFLTPSRMAGEAVEEHSPRTAYLLETGGEAMQFALAGKLGQKAKTKTAEFKTRRAISKSIAQSRNSGLRVMDLIKERKVNIDKALLDSEIFVRQFERDLSPQELEAIPFIRQGIKDTSVLKEVGKENLIPLVENPSPKLQKAVEKIGKYYDESHAFLRDHWGEDIGYVKDYVTQFWEVPKKRQAEVVNYFATRNPFLKKRKIPTLEEGIKLGLKPKTTNIAELLRMYDQYKIKTAFNIKFAEGLKGMVDAEGTPLMMRVDKAPPDWVTIDHPALNRAMGVGKTEKGDVILQKVPVKVHPDIAKEVQIVFDKPFSHGAIRALETVNAYTKKSMLSVSLFHHFALTEAAFSSGIGRKAVRMWNPYSIYNSIKRGKYEIFENVELAQDAIEHGVNFGPLPEVHVSQIERSLRNVEHKTRKVPALKHVTKKLRQVNSLWDRSLWDYYHNTLKLYAYEHQVMKEIKRRKPKTPEEISQIKNEIGTFVNDSFGGQNWDLSRMFGNPKMRQIAHWILLAPDWTVSTLKQAVAPVRGIATGKGSMAARGTLFWIRAAFYFNLVAQSINYTMTQRDYGKGRFTWDNAPGHSLDIYFGRNEDGTERYIRLGKQFREVGEWLIEPERKLGAKLSPVTREGIRQLAHHDPGSGYPTPWEEMEFWESLPERLKSVAEMPLPFSLRPYVEDRPKMFMFSLPSSKGMTNYKAIKVFKEAIKEGNIKEIKHIYVSALENNLDAEQLFKSAKSAVKADITFDDKQMAREILKELSQLDPVAQADALRVYLQRGVITPGIRKQMNRLLNQQERIERQKERLGIR